MDDRSSTLIDQSPEPISGDNYQLAPDAALGQASDAIAQAAKELKLPATICTSFQGNAQAFQDSFSTVPLLIIAAGCCLFDPWHSIRELHPSILSILPSAGVGALAMLILFHFDFSLIALIGIILLVGIVKKNGIMMVDFAIVEMINCQPATPSAELPFFVSDPL
jgi:HAE1 family hydrophobic/amphiphilic exporter-1